MATRQRAGRWSSTPWSNGTTHLLLSPHELLEKLAALVPPPRLNLIRYHGCLAPNARDRDRIVPGAADEPSMTGESDSPPGPHRLSWCQLLARVADAPFKLFYQGPSSKMEPGLYVALSKDGYGWERLPGPLTNTGERTHAMLDRIDGQYVVLAKAEHPEQYGGRCVVITMSGELRDFSEPQLIMKQDLLDGFNTEIYGMVAFPYADRYIGLLERYYGIPDLIDICLAWSDDLVTWERPPQREAFIAPEYPWNKRWSSPASSPPIRKGNQLWFFFGGRSGAHGHSKPNAAPVHSAIGLATITVDRFASLSAGFRDGKLVTRPMVWPGGDLAINASTSAALDGDPRLKNGEMRVEVLNAHGQPVEGFSGDHSVLFKDNMPMRGFTDSAVLRWPGDRSANVLLAAARAHGPVRDRIPIEGGTPPRRARPGAVVGAWQGYRGQRLQPARARLCAAVQGMATGASTMSPMHPSRV